MCENVARQEPVQVRALYPQTTIQPGGPEPRNPMIPEAKSPNPEGYSKFRDANEAGVPGRSHLGRPVTGLVAPQQ